MKNEKKVELRGAELREVELREAELLAPAGSYETFRAVIAAGADAVYLGGSRFGARAYANNLDETELLSAIDYAHIHGRKVYLTVNTLLKEEELKELYCYLLPYYRQGLDAVIVQDFGAFDRIRKEFPGLDIHTSTQMTVTNSYGARMMKELGANRVVTAREMSYEEISAIHREVDIELESFVHGALCYCFSGQCLLSSMLGGRSGNRGRCAQPCRLAYEVFDEKKHSVKANGRSGESFILSPKDLCTIHMIPKLIESGIYSFKIEGRMKQAEYAAGVVSIYRDYIDRYFADPSQFKAEDTDYKKLLALGNRSGFTDGYYTKHNGKEMITFDKPGHSKSNEALQNEIRERFIREEIKEKINGKLRLSQDFPAILEVSAKGVTVTVQGDIPQPALKQPLTAEKAAANLKKTGNTPFEFENLAVEIEGDVFLPVQALNQLRREGLEKLQEKLSVPFHREACIQVEPQDKEYRKDLFFAETEKKSLAVSMKSLAVSIEDKKLLPLLCSNPLVDDIYLDFSCYTRENLTAALKKDVSEIKESKKKAYFIFPTVFRLSTARFYESIREELINSGIDGVVVKSADALQFVREQLKLSFIIDANLYTFNNQAKQLLQTYEPLRDTVPFELNRRELLARDNRNSEIVIYGHLPLMTSAQCVHANSGKCDKKPQTMYLKDRYGKFFPVKNQCSECYNTIYNTAPLVLFPFRRDFEKMKLFHYRIAFTTENENRAKEVLAAYRKLFIEEKGTVADYFAKEYTNGHYKRGVE